MPILNGTRDDDLTIKYLLENNKPDLTEIESKIDEINSELATLFDRIYPVGSIYTSINSTDPSVLFGGTLEQIKDTFLLACGTTYTNGDTGGKSTYTAADMPAHTHTRGTMEISGTYKTAWQDSSGGGIINAGNWSGALDGFKSGNSLYTGGNTGTAANHNNWLRLTASKNWTGETSQSGTNVNATIMPPYLAVYVWKRTA